jgi:predicted TIM-barrel fold metal-dependent hydrolase
VTYRGRLIDVDVHNTWASDADLLEYLPAEWRGYVTADGRQPMSTMPGKTTWLLGSMQPRFDSLPEDAGPQGSDYDSMRIHALDRLNSERTILNFGVGWQTGLQNPYFAAAMCAAANQWMVDRWLSLPDARLHGSILVPTELPERGAAEIRRWADHPRVVQALLVCNPIGKPFGHPLYDPVFEAAAEVGMPLAIHVGGEAAGDRESAGGTPATMLERYPVIGQPGAHYLTSFITHGVFERYPTLKLLLLEFGFTWLPSVVWRLDDAYKELRAECPWVRRRPSEYVREHVKLSTQPFDWWVPADRMRRFIDSYPDFERLLCFASDYPHWDADEPGSISSRIPAAWRQNVFADNASEFYGWGDGPADVARARQADAG